MTKEYVWYSPELDEIVSLYEFYYDPKELKGKKLKLIIPMYDTTAPRGIRNVELFYIGEL